MHALGLVFHWNAAFGNLSEIQLGWCAGEIHFCWQRSIWVENFQRFWATTIILTLESQICYHILIHQHLYFCFKGAPSMFACS